MKYMFLLYSMFFFFSFQQVNCMEPISLLAKVAAQAQEAEPKNLLEAVDSGNIEKVKIFLEQKTKEELNISFGQTSDCDLNPKNIKNYTPLTLATHKGLKDIVALLLASGVAPGKSDKFKWSPLVYAINDGNLEMVKLLINNNANQAFKINQENKKTQSKQTETMTAYRLAIKLSNSQPTINREQIKNFLKKNTAEKSKQAYEKKLKRNTKIIDKKTMINSLNNRRHDPPPYFCNVIANYNLAQK